jgi:uncharacterized membrane protein
MARAAPTHTRRPPETDGIARRGRPLNHFHKDVLGTATPLDRLAIWITVRVGSMGFFLCILIWTVAWLGWNLLAPKALEFDPPTAFVFWLFISNVIQILLMPLIMVGQNLLGRHAELRAERDLEVNVRAEQEIGLILQHLEYQNRLLIAMVGKLDIELEPPPNAPR